MSAKTRPCGWNRRPAREYPRLRRCVSLDTWPCKKLNASAPVKRRMPKCAKRPDDARRRWSLYMRWERQPRCQRRMPRWCLFSGKLSSVMSTPEESVPSMPPAESVEPAPGRKPRSRNRRTRGTGADALRRLGTAWPLHRFLTALRAPSLAARSMLMPARGRPTSPHVWLYRWQIGNTLSILHRMTGAALALGLMALSYWFVSLAGGAGYLCRRRAAFRQPPRTRWCSSDGHSHSCFTC